MGPQLYRTSCASGLTSNTGGDSGLAMPTGPRSARRSTRAATRAAQGRLAPSVNAHPLGRRTPRDSRVETASARALEETDVLGIKSELVRALCNEDPQAGCEIYRNLIEVVSARLAAMRLRALDVHAAGTAAASSSASDR